MQPEMPSILERRDPTQGSATEITAERTSLVPQETLDYYATLSITALRQELESAKKRAADYRKYNETRNIPLETQRIQILTALIQEVGGQERVITSPRRTNFLDTLFIGFAEFNKLSMLPATVRSNGESAAAAHDQVNGTSRVDVSDRATATNSTSPALETESEPQAQTQPAVDRATRTMSLQEQSQLERVQAQDDLTTRREEEKRELAQFVQENAVRVLGTLPDHVSYARDGAEIIRLILRDEVLKNEDIVRKLKVVDKILELLPPTPAAQVGAATERIIERVSQNFTSDPTAFQNQVETELQAAQNFFSPEYTFSPAELQQIRREVTTRIERRRASMPVTPAQAPEPSAVAPVAPPMESVAESEPEVEQTPVSLATVAIQPELAVDLPETVEKPDTVSVPAAPEANLTPVTSIIESVGQRVLQAGMQTPESALQPVSLLTSNLRVSESGAVESTGGTLTSADQIMLNVAAALENRRFTAEELATIRQEVNNRLSRHNLLLEIATVMAGKLPETTDVPQGDAFDDVLSKSIYDITAAGLIGNLDFPQITLNTVELQIVTQHLKNRLQERQLKAAAESGSDRIQAEAAQEQKPGFFKRLFGWGKKSA